MTKPTTQANGWLSVAFRTVDGTTFTSSIKEKTAGRALYAQARAKGKSAGLVR